MKFSKSQIHTRVHGIPEVRFEEQRLTAYAGLVIFQALFQKLDLKARLRECFSHQPGSPIFGPHIALMLLVVHLLVGYRRLRELDFYREDPLVLRLLGLERLPDVSTISRTLGAVDTQGLVKTRRVSREVVLNRLEIEALRRVTLDFDGSVLSTTRRAEGSAVGYNKKKKGARSYYPLFCTVAQTRQFLEFLYRSGNVHDSNGSVEFMKDCFSAVRQRLPGCRLETRTDGAFFSEKTVEMLEEIKVEYSLSVPFDRFVELKGIIEARQRWNKIDDTWSYFEEQWMPQKWDSPYRFIFVRQAMKVQTKGPLQLDLFEPIEREYQYKVIITNKGETASRVIQFHHGRGSQEAIIGEAKQDSGLSYIPMRKMVCNELYCTAVMMAHNLAKEVQMENCPRDRGTTAKRGALWFLETLSSLRQKLIHRAGRITRPAGKLTLTLNANDTVEQELHGYLKNLQAA